MNASRDAADAPRPRGRRPTLSADAVIEAAVSLLDEAGQSALTFRALAARLDTGVGAIYHYVSGRDELLDRATNAMLDPVVAQLGLPDDPYDAMRELSLALYDAMQAHPWSGAFLMRDATLQPNAMRLFEALGQQTMKLELSIQERFDATSSVLSFVIGAGAEMRELPAAVLDDDKTQQEHLAEFAASWRALDADEFPFLHSIADGFAEHDDREQFAAGVELLLAGIRAQVAG